MKVYDLINHAGRLIENGSLAILAGSVRLVRNNVVFPNRTSRTLKETEILGVSFVCVVCFYLHSYKSFVNSPLCSTDKHRACDHDPG